MKVLSTLTFLCIMGGTGGTMNAQSQPQSLIGLPEHKIHLGGTPDDPFVINGSTNHIACYVLEITDSAGTNFDITRCNPDPHPLMQDMPIGPGENNNPGPKAVKPIHPDGRPITVHSVQLDSVIFTDGEMVGPNKADIFMLLFKGFKLNKEEALKKLLDPARFKGGKK